MIGSFAVYTINNDVYFTDEIEYQSMGDAEPRALFVVFRPKNGSHIGKLHHFPLHTISHIVDRGVVGHRVHTSFPQDNIDLARDMERGK